MVQPRSNGCLPPIEYGLFRVGIRYVWSNPAQMVVYPIEYGLFRVGIRYVWSNPAQMVVYPRLNMGCSGWGSDMFGPTPLKWLSTPPLNMGCSGWGSDMFGPTPLKWLSTPIEYGLFRVGIRYVWSNPAQMVVDPHGYVFFWRTPFSFFKGHRNPNAGVEFCRTGPTSLSHQEVLQPNTRPNCPTCLL